MTKRSNIGVKGQHHFQVYTPYKAIDHFCYDTAHSLIQCLRIPPQTRPENGHKRYAFWRFG